MKLKDLITEKKKVVIKRDNNFSNYKFKMGDSVEFIHPGSRKKEVGKVVGKERIVRQGDLADEDFDETFINIVSDGDAISVLDDNVLRKVNSIKEGMLNPKEEAEIQKEMGYVKAYGKYWEIINVYPKQRRKEVTFEGPEGLETCGFNQLTKSTMEYKGKPVWKKDI